MTQEEKIVEAVGCGSGAQPLGCGENGLGAETGLAEEIPGKARKGDMGQGCHCTAQRRGSQPEGGNVEDVFHHRKTDPAGDGVEDTVHRLAEFLRSPDG